MAEFVPVCKTTDVPEPGKAYFEIDQHVIVVFHVEGRFYCLDDVCTHDDGPLGEGQLYGHEIACPRHGARFDIRDGRVISMPATTATAAHEVKVEGEDILVRLSSE